MSTQGTHNLIYLVSRDDWTAVSCKTSKTFRQLESDGCCCLQLVWGIERHNPSRIMSFGGNILQTSFCPSIFRKGLYWVPAGEDLCWTTIYEKKRSIDSQISGCHVTAECAKNIRMSHKKRLTNKSLSLLSSIDIP